MLTKYADIIPLSLMKMINIIPMTRGYECALDFEAMLKNIEIKDNEKEN